MYIIPEAAQIGKKESNFFFANYSLILEMQEDMWWVWRAHSDHHGTTMCRLAAEHPTNWQEYMNCEPDRGQWTAVDTIPRRVALAAGRAYMHTVVDI